MKLILESNVKPIVTLDGKVFNVLKCELYLNEEPDNVKTCFMQIQQQGSSGAGEKAYIVFYPSFFVKNTYSDDELVQYARGQIKMALNFPEADDEWDYQELDDGSEAAILYCYQ